MHAVECPKCGRRFGVAQPVRDARMRCGKCGEQFVGSSVEVPSAAPPTAGTPRPAAPPAGRSPFGPQEPRVQRGASPAGRIALLVGGFALIAGTIVLLVLFIVYRNHVTVYVTDEHGRTVKRSMSRSEYDRMREADMARAESTRRLPPLAPPAPGPGAAVAPVGPGPVGPGPGPVSPPPVEPAGPVSDPNIAFGRPEVVQRGIGTADFFACGSLTSSHTVALRSVTVTAYARATAGEAVRYEYVPVGGEIRFSAPLPGEVKAEEVTLVALVEKAGADEVVWAVDPNDILRVEGEESQTDLLWRGRTRNPSSTAVKDVKVYCDFFFPNGVQAGSEVGRADGDGIIGPDKYGRFEVTSSDPVLGTCGPPFARAAGKVY